MEQFDRSANVLIPTIHLLGALNHYCRRVTFLKTQMVYLIICKRTSSILSSQFSLTTLTSGQPVPGLGQLGCWPSSSFYFFVFAPPSGHHPARKQVAGKEERTLEASRQGAVRSLVEEVLRPKVQVPGAAPHQHAAQRQEEMLHRDGHPIDDLVPPEAAENNVMHDREAQEEVQEELCLGIPDSKKSIISQIHRSQCASKRHKLIINILLLKIFVRLFVAFWLA